MLEDICLDRAGCFKLPIDPNVGHTRDAQLLRPRDLCLDLLDALGRLEVPLDLAAVQARGLGGAPQRGLVGDVLLELKVALEQLVHDAVLDVEAAPLVELGVPDQAVRVLRVARPPAKAELDAGVAPHGRQRLLDLGEAVLAEAAHVARPLVLPLPRRAGVEVEGVPGNGKGVVGARVRRLVRRDAGLEAALADVAPRADRVADDFDVELHFKKCNDNQNRY